MSVYSINKDNDFYGHIINLSFGSLIDYFILSSPSKSTRFRLPPHQRSQARFEVGLTIVIALRAFDFQSIKLAKVKLINPPNHAFYNHPTYARMFDWGKAFLRD